MKTGNELEFDANDSKRPLHGGQRLNLCSSAQVLRTHCLFPLLYQRTEIYFKYNFYSIVTRTTQHTINWKEYRPLVQVIDCYKLYLSRVYKVARDDTFTKIDLNRPFIR